MSERRQAEREQQIDVLIEGLRLDAESDIEDKRDIYDALRDLRTELAAERKRHEWQPIETAQNDGRWILMYLRSPWSHVHQFRWLLSDDYAPYWQVIGDAYRYPDSAFTHWMPLPAPPTEAK